MALTRLQASTITDSDFKTSCKVATNENIANFESGTPSSIDGVNLSIGDRILVKAQDNAAENGIYTVVSVGTGSNGRWARAVDFRSNVSISSGSITFIENGTNANTFYYLAGGIGTVTVGSTNLTFRSFAVAPPGSNTQVLFNNNGEFGTSSSLTWNGANLAITGNILANGFYFSNGSPFTVDSTQILNGNSNVKVAANSDISFGVAGNSNVVVITGTGANINGYANITGDTTVGGNLTVTGDFTVNGTTTTLNTSTLDVEDLNITLAKGAASSSAANGAGITIDGASATFVYNSITNTWVSSHGANITGSANVTGNVNVGNLGATTLVATDLTGNLTTAAQPNITSVGTLSSLSVTGNASAGNLNTAGKVVGSVLESNVSTGTAPLTVISTTQVANLNAATAGHAVTSNTVVDASQPNITSVGTLGSLIVSGNANVGNILAGGFYFANGSPFTVDTTQILNGNSNVLVAANSNVTVSVAGNANVVTVTGTGANISGTANVTGNANTGNLGTGTIIATAANLTTINSGLVQNGNSNVTITANSNVSIFINGNATARAVFTSTGANIAGTANVTGNLSVGGILTDNYYYANGTVISFGGASFTTSATAPVGPTVGDFWYDSSSDILYQYINDGSGNLWLDLSSIPNSFSSIIATTANLTTINSGLMQNGNSNVVIAANGNVGVSATGTANVLSVANTGITVTGNISVSGNITDTGALTIATSSNGNLTLSPNGTGAVVTTTNLLPNANATLSLGSTTNRWANLWGLASSAQYADLAERYHADSPYDPGTVVVFGGLTEITVTNIDHDTRIAGVISTEPAYLMNDSADKGNLWLPVALTGRVPCQVQGPVNKGDLIVASTTPGVGRKMNKDLYEPGCVIGKSLEDHTENTVKNIEVVVGRF